MTPTPQPPIRISSADPDSPAACACLSAYYRLLLDKIPELHAGQLPLPLPNPETYRPPQGAFLIAWAKAQPLGCVSLRPLGPTLGEVKRLWVDPAARGQGLARRLMHAIEEQARALGQTRLRLDTNSALPEAIALYRATGWTDIAPYTDFPADCWFEKHL
ncbi:MAG: GNAT family N-acetyltransferase [Rhodobacteraceae bacterium]|nr:GNAT family N-acetyltransferase [Paracoccaceae bacterium]